MDQDLVLQAQKGDQRAFESLAAANHHRLFKVANGILRDPHLAEDATQQAFIDIWQDIRRLVKLHGYILEGEPPAIE